MSMSGEPRELTPRRPRVVAPPPSDDEGPDYTYFAFKGPEQLEELKKKIEQNERHLFDLETGAAMLEGAPAGPVPHRTVGEGEVPCSCNACQLKLYKRSIEQVKYGLGKLRAIYAKITS